MLMKISSALLIHTKGLPCDHCYNLEVKPRYGFDDRYWATVAMDSCVSPADREGAIEINPVDKTGWLQNS